MTADLHQSRPSITARLPDMRRDGSVRSPVARTRSTRSACCADRERWVRSETRRPWLDLLACLFVGLCAARAVWAGSWTSNGPALAVITALAVDPNVTDVVYAGTADGVFKTFDGGATWARVSVGLPASGRVRALVVDPVVPSTVYAGVYRAC